MQPSIFTRKQAKIKHAKLITYLVFIANAQFIFSMHVCEYKSKFINTL